MNSISHKLIASVMLLLFIITFVPASLISYSSNDNGVIKSTYLYQQFITVDPQSIRVEHTAEGNLITIDGLRSVSFSNLVVPAKILHIALPPGTTNISLICSFNERSKVDLGLNITSSFAFGVLDKIISENSHVLYPFPDTCAKIHSIDRGPGGVIVAVIHVYPVKYLSPSIISVGNVTVEVKAEYYETGLKLVPAWIFNLVDNRADAEKWYSAVSSTGYVIVLGDASFYDAILPLARLRIAQGYDVKIYTLDEVVDEFPANTTQDSLRLFAQYAVDNWNAGYLLLVGDSNLIPPLYFYAEEEFTGYGETEWKPTDLYYSLLNGTWDPNGNGRPLESLDTNDDNYPDDIVEPLPDNLSDILVGRLPVSDADDLTVLVNNIITRETKGWDTGKALLVMAAIANYENEDETSYPKTDDAVVGEWIVNTSLAGQVLDPNRSFSYVRLYEDEGLDPTTYPHELSLNSDNAYAEMSNGYMYIASSAHGSQTAQYRKIWSSDDGDGVPESDEMTWRSYIYAGTLPELPYPSILYLSACLTGYFDYTSQSLAESLLFHGASNVVASTRISYYQVGWSSPSNGAFNQEFEFLFWDHLFRSGVNTVGEALYSSKYDYASAYSLSSEYAHMKDYLIFDLLGDPATRIYVNQSQEMNINIETNDTTVLVQVVNSYTLEPVVGADIILETEEGTLIYTGETNTSGELEIPKPVIPGSYYLYVLNGETSPINYTVITIQQAVVGEENLKIVVESPTIAYVNDSVEVYLAFLYNGSLVLPDNYTLFVAPDTALESVEEIDTSIGPMLKVTLYSANEGQVILYVKGEYNGSVDIASTSVYFSSYARSNETQDILSLLYEVLGNQADILDKLELINQTLAGIITDINESTARILTETGAIQANITEINARLVAIEGNIAIINSTLGVLLSTTQSIDARIVSVQNNQTIIVSKLGNITLQLEQINASIETIMDNILVINTTLGDLLVTIGDINTSQGILLQEIGTANTRLLIINTTLQSLEPKIEEIRGSLVIINTSLGNIQADLGTLINATLENARLIRQGNDYLLDLTTMLGNITIKLENTANTTNSTLAKVLDQLFLLQNNITTIITSTSAIEHNITMINAKLDSILFEINESTQQILLAINVSGERILVKLDNLEENITSQISLSPPTTNTGEATTSPISSETRPETGFNQTGSSMIKIIILALTVTAVIAASFILLVRHKTGHV